MNRKGSVLLSEEGITIRTGEEPPPRDERLVSRSLSLKSIDREARTCDFVASTDAVDSYDEIVEQDWNLERFKANPIVLYGHNSWSKMPIGQCTACDVVMRDGRPQLECTIKFASKEANPEAEMVWQLVQERVLRAVSVGFRPGDYRLEKRNGQDVYVLSQNELHEISVVPIPANPEALAKMRARAKAKAAKTTAPDGREENSTMTLEEMKALLAQRESEKSAAEKELADARTRVAALEAQNSVLSGERDALKAETAKLAASLVEREVEALVGVKITPAEKELFVELATSNRDLFTKMVAQRSDLKLLGAPVVAPDPTPGVVDEKAGADALGDIALDLAAKDASL